MSFEKKSIFRIEMPITNLKEFFTLLRTFFCYFVLIGSGNKMRTVSWLFLILSFALGIGCAFIVRHYLFEAKSAPITEQKPTIKILVAKQTIPQGAEITAEALTFVEVPLAELPAAAITGFDQVYRRRSAYPISVGCPVCEDLLLPYQEKDWETEKFIPAGMQIVSLEIEQVLLNGNAVELSIPITNNLSPDQRIDIRLFPKEASQGELIERKNQLLKAFMPQNEVTEKGELLFENLEILQIQNQLSFGKKQRQIPTLTLVLEKEYVAHLIAAARKGRLRVVPHRQANLMEPSPVPSNATQNIATENSENIVADEIRNIITGNADLSDNSNNNTTEISDNTINNTTDNAADTSVDMSVAKTVDKTTDNASDITTDVSLSISASDPAAPEIIRHIPETPPKKRFSLTFIPPEIPVAETSEEIRGDIPSIAVAPLPGFYREKTGIFDSEVHSPAEKKTARFSPHVIEIGLPAANEALEKPAKKNYSPWGQSSVVIKPKPDSEIKNDYDPDILIQPVLRNRKKM
ncbi:MAG: SAF domain-containing protein [Planctomycetaceae bacterium]|jgi:Flp pilus assembly protein CpaB|nr:SAF domain-containing protein [Planctomycetaceae bacterium]